MYYVRLLVVIIVLFIPLYFSGNKTLRNTCRSIKINRSCFQLLAASLYEFLLRSILLHFSSQNRTALLNVLFLTKVILQNIVLYQFLKTNVSKVSNAARSSFKKEKKLQKKTGKKKTKQNIKDRLICFIWSVFVFTSRYPFPYRKKVINEFLQFQYIKFTGESMS